MDFLSANSRFPVQNVGTYLPRITRETCNWYFWGSFLIRCTLQCFVYFIASCEKHRKCNILVVCTLLLLTWWYHELFRQIVLFSTFVLLCCLRMFVTIQFTMLHKHCMPSGNIRTRNTKWFLNNLFTEEIFLWHSILRHDLSQSKETGRGNGAGLDSTNIFLTNCDDEHFVETGDNSHVYDRKKVHYPCSTKFQFFFWK